MSSLRFDPFRELDRWASEVMGAARTPRLMPMDAYRDGETYVLRLDLPGIDLDSMEILAENNTLTVRAERRHDGPEGAQYVLAERPSGTYSRQIVLGDGLDVDAISADYHNGVLTVTIPVAEQAKPRRIQIGHGGGQEHKMISESPTAAEDRQAAATGASA
jgi:HSP20 family protein